MAKKHDYTITLDGQPHHLHFELKVLFGKVVVWMDNQFITQKIDWFGAADIMFSYCGHDIAITKQSRKFRVAVDKRYIDNGAEFIPIGQMPVFIWVGVAFVIIEVILSFLIAGGWFGALLGLLSYLALVKIGRSNMSGGAKTGAMIGVIIGMYALYALLAVAVFTFVYSSYMRSTLN